MRARGTDFSNAKTDAVNIGTVVQATDLDTSQPESFTILGAWDSDPDKGMISYLSPVGAGLLNHKVGDEVEFELHGTKRRHRIEKIEVWQAAAPVKRRAGGGRIGGDDPGGLRIRPRREADASRRGGLSGKGRCTGERLCFAFFSIHASTSPSPGPVVFSTFRGQCRRIPRLLV